MGGRLRDSGKRRGAVCEGDLMGENGWGFVKKLKKRKQARIFFFLQPNPPTKYSFTSNGRRTRLAVKIIKDDTAVRYVDMRVVLSYSTSKPERCTRKNINVCVFRVGEGFRHT